MCDTRSFDRACVQADHSRPEGLLAFGERQKRRNFQQKLAKHPAESLTQSENRRMVQRPTAVVRLNPKFTEAYLLSLPDVLDASVWVSQGDLHAHVTVGPNHALNADTIRAACMTDLGELGTPKSVLLISSSGYAA